MYLTKIVEDIISIILVKNHREIQEKPKAIEN